MTLKPLTPAFRAMIRDRFEAQDEAFFDRAIAGYEARRLQMPQRFLRIDARAERLDVWQQIETHVQSQPWW